MELRPNLKVFEIMPGFPSMKWNSPILTLPISKAHSSSVRTGSKRSQTLTAHVAHIMPACHQPSENGNDEARLQAFANLIAGQGDSDSEDDRNPPPLVDTSSEGEGQERNPTMPLSCARVLFSDSEDDNTNRIRPQCASWVSQFPRNPDAPPTSLIHASPNPVWQASRASLFQ